MRSLLRDLSLLAVGALFCGAAAAEGSRPIVIQGGMVIDGTGAPRQRTDIVVQDGRIAHILNLETARMSFDGDPIHIDATGMVVTPGFIDTHAHGNPLRTPEFENFLAMGVTTVCLGMDGSSPTTDPWDEWFEKVDEAAPGPNVAPFVGHGTVRKVSGTEYDKEPTEEQIAAMAALVREAMEAGCWGMTTGIEYIPGTFATRGELIGSAKPVAEFGGLVMSHMRTEDDGELEAAIDELLAQGEGAGCPVHISHFKVVYGKGTDRAEELLAKLDAARARGTRVTADVYPYTASYTGIGIVFPEWAKPPNEWEEVKAERREDLREYLRNRVNLRNGPEATLLGMSPYTGRTLKDVADEMGLPFEDVLIDHLGPGGGSAAYFVMNETLQGRLLQDPNVMVCSDGSPTMHHPRGYGSFAKILRYYVRETGMLSLEEAVHKMSGLPAKTVGLSESGERRGLLRKGYAADILIFDPETVADTATFDDPHRLSAGIDTIIVNGVAVRNGGDWSEERAGRVLRKR